MKPHERMGDIARQICVLFDGWVVGGSANYIAGVTDDPPKDIDIVVPVVNWLKASKLVPKGTLSNSFGGFKIKDTNGMDVDFWPDDVAGLVKDRDIHAYHLLSGVMIGRINNA